MSTVDHHLVELALQRVGGVAFERFANAFFASLSGADFVPLGGTHDGGADAFSEQGVFEERGTKRFWQATVEPEHRSKIRRTVRRLQEFGREPGQLTYCTSSIVPHSDREEDFLGDELGLRVRIRDQRYIVAHANNSAQAIEAFNSYLSPELAFLQQIGGTTVLSHAPPVAARALCVFLGQELERRRGNTDLLEAVTDSLILWALEGTDPDRSKLMDKAAIQKKIEGALPAAKHFIRGVLDNRLEILTQKSNPSGRQLRFYRNEQAYCLPYETREIVRQENTEDESLKLDVSIEFSVRAAEYFGQEIPEGTIDSIVNICH